MSFKNELKRAIAKHLTRPDLPFSISETEPGSYDAIFPGNKLPTIDYDGLAVKLSAKARFHKSDDGSSFDSAVFAGQFKDQPVIVFLRATVPAQ
jgi:hypothetical protein